MRETASLTRFKAINRAKNPQFLVDGYGKPKQLPQIMVKLNHNKHELELTLAKNHFKLNSSFSDYFRSDINASRDFHLQRKVTKLKKIE